MAQPKKIKEFENVPYSELVGIRRAWADENKDAGYKKYELWELRNGPNDYTVEVWENPNPNK